MHTNSASDIFIGLMAIGLLVIMIPWCATFAYRGLWIGETFTHFGMGRGVWAKIWGGIYVVYLLAACVGLLVAIHEILSWDFSEVVAALKIRYFMQPLAALILLCFAILVFVATPWFIRWRMSHDVDFANKPARLRATREIFLLMGGMFFILGVFGLVGVPIGIVVLASWIFGAFYAWPNRFIIALTKSNPV